MSLEVLNAGFLTLIQDFGRYGLQKFGITSGGPLDEHAFLWANRLLGNVYDSPVLEISLGGFTARFNQNTMIALCGADLSATLNGQSIFPWQTYFVRQGDEIKFISPRSGLRAYLAVKGGFLIKPHLMSCATVIKEKLGGLRQDGEKITDSDLLPYELSAEEKSRSVPQQFIPDYSNQINLRFFPNYSVTGSTESMVEAFTMQTYKVSQNIDRMGYRLEGKSIEHNLSGITSQGMSVGAIQLPKDGQPIVLMKDKQTMGGYPLLGNLAYLDVAKLAQAKPGTEIKFSPVVIETMERELRAYKNFFRITV
jgi:biotin-dependent carboxylase-like uncharacterized protein